MAGESALSRGWSSDLDALNAVVASWACDAAWAGEDVGAREDRGGTTRMLMTALASTGVGLCLCDEQDRIRYMNEAMRAAFFPTLAPFRDGAKPMPFGDALRQAIPSSGSMKLESRPLEEFIASVRDKRRALRGERSFSVDLKDGRWLYINDHKLPNGWILAVAMNISALKQEEFRLREAHSSALRASHTDTLTDLANRRRGMELAEEALAAARASGRPLTLALLDVDRFKHVNDTYGHAAGDAILVAFARTLDREAGSYAGLSRIGGEEFLMVMPSVAASEAKARLDDLLEVLRPVGPTERGESLPYTFSAGIAAFRAPDTLASLLGRADAALYRAKRNGRARVETEAGVQAA